MPRENNRGVFEKVKGSGVWYVKYADRPHHIKKERAGTKAQARALYQRRKQEQEAAGLIGPRGAVKAPPAPAAAPGTGVLFEEIAADALAYCRRHARFDDDEHRLRTMTGWWGALPAGELKPQEIEVRLSSLTKQRGVRKDAPPTPVSNALFNRYRSLLSLAYRLAQKYGKVPLGYNPARLVELRKEPKRVRWLSHEEEGRLREVLSREYPDRPWAAMLDIALNCGLRWSDQAALKPEQREDNVLRLTTRKTDTPLRLGLNPIAAKAFDKLQSEAGEQGELCSIRSPRHWFKRALRLAGIENFRWHDLRHTFATRLLTAGVPAEQVQLLLGQSSIEMALRYAHVVGNYQTDALARLAEVNERAAKGGAPVVAITGAKRARPNLRRAAQ